MNHGSDRWINKYGLVIKAKEFIKQNRKVLMSFSKSVDLESAYLGSTGVLHQLAVHLLIFSLKHALRVCFMITAMLESKQ
jgi:hypothetical protein